ncbi:hypothetical protein CVT24_005289 [Panaeolus cyanescens]|uniref:Uncharacterized protein n=1 Tax=Panaeolus cyanescens TaxID=181874 RepID=A0A409Y952_9AGAR|nr:hypothetical protein CVT24_005289 [Panaeolus cyanescens]
MRRHTIPTPTHALEHRATRLSLEQGTVENPFTFEYEGVKYTICKTDASDTGNTFACVPFNEVSTIRAATIAVERRERHIKLLEMEVAQLRQELERLKIEKALMNTQFATDNPGFQVMVVNSAWAQPNEGAILE